MAKTSHDGDLLADLFGQNLFARFALVNDFDSVRCDGLDVEGESNGAKSALADDIHQDVLVKHGIFSPSQPLLPSSFMVHLYPGLRLGRDMGTSRRRCHDEVEARRQVKVSETEVGGTVYPAAVLMRNRRAMRKL